jgi:hypothetical protein
MSYSFLSVVRSYINQYMKVTKKCEAVVVAFLFY